MQPGSQPALPAARARATAPPADLVGLLRIRADAGPALAWPSSAYAGWARRLALARRLRRHTGCVNTATWSGDGAAIVSSGDDTNCMVWRAAAGGPAARSPLLQFPTTHTSNVFDAKLVDDSVRRGSRIVTCARDGRVLEHTLTGTSRAAASTRELSHAVERYAPVHRLSVSRLHHDDVCSAAADGVVRRFDLRAAAPCVAAFVATATMELNVCAFHPVHEHVVLIAGGAPDVRLFDLRRPGPPLQRLFPRDVASVLRCARLLAVTGADWSADGRDCCQAGAHEDAMAPQAHRRRRAGDGERSGRAGKLARGGHARRRARKRVSPG